MYSRLRHEQQRRAEVEEQLEALVQQIEDRQPGATEVCLTLSLSSRGKVMCRTCARVLDLHVILGKTLGHGGHASLLILLACRLSLSRRLRSCLGRYKLLPSP